MKKILSISLGPSSNDYEISETFLGQEFQIRRIGTDGDIEQASSKLMELGNTVDAIGLGDVSIPYSFGEKSLFKRNADILKKLGSQFKVPVTTGDELRHVTQEWAIRHAQFTLGNYFNQAKVMFFSGMINYNAVKAISEFTENVIFADAIYEDGIPKFLNSKQEFESYAQGLNKTLKWIPTRTFVNAIKPLQEWNQYIVKKAMQDNFVIVVPYHDFYNYLGQATVEELAGKVVITSTANNDRIEFLKDKGVDVIIDCTPKVFSRTVDLNILESMIILASHRNQSEITTDDFLEIITDHKMDPRIIYPSGSKKRKNRFAFVIHPLSQEYFKNIRPIEMITNNAPPVFMDIVEKVMAYAPPFVYSKMAGIKSPTGVEAEGWLITIGGTPNELMKRPPEFTYSRLIDASKMAKKLGAQIIGLGAFTSIIGDEGLTVAKLAELPVTTGNSYKASCALWASAEAARKMQLLEIEQGKKIKGKAMIVGATDSIGAVCSRLLGLAFDEVYMIARNMAKLVEIRRTINEEKHDIQLHISTHAEKYLPMMDVIVIATYGKDKPTIDIMKVKPGCIITDIARPLSLSKEEIKRRPDILYIESGEVRVPGDIEMRNIGLPQNMVYSSLAETIILALESKFENYTVGNQIEWQKVREIYNLGLKNGFTLSGISGIDGIVSDEDIQTIKKLAIEKRKKALEKPAWIGD